MMLLDSHVVAPKSTITLIAAVEGVRLWLCSCLPCPFAQQFAYLHASRHVAHSNSKATAEDRV